MLRSPERRLQVEGFGHIEKWRESGLSQKNYCTENSLSLSSFRGQLSIFQKSRLKGGEREASQEVASKFVPVKVISPPVSPSSGYEIIFPSGIIIKLPLLESLSVLIKSLEVYL